METLSWHSVERHLATGRPFLLGMGGSRGVTFGYLPAQRRMFVRLPSDPDPEVPVHRLRELEVETRRTEDGSVLEISTTSPELHREFHRLAGLLTEDFDKGGQSASDTLDTALRRWRELATLERALTEQQQLGLFGELLVLGALIRRDGAAMVDAWTGRDPLLPDRHDFRLPQIDLEVKVTRGTNHRHLINGLRQLAPTPGHRLFLLSIVVQPAGAGSGTSLRELVARTRELTATSSAAAKALAMRLAAANYEDRHEGAYAARLSLAEPPRLIEVGRECQGITPLTIEAALGSNHASRIGNVVYELDVDGLGCSQGSPNYTAILPGLEVLTA